MKNIQEWLGHTNFNTTADVHSHVDFSSKLQSAVVISSALKEDKEVNGECENLDYEIEVFEKNWKKSIDSRKNKRQKCKNLG